MVEPVARSVLRLVAPVVVAFVVVALRVVRLKMVEEAFTMMPSVEVGARYWKGDVPKVSKVWPKLEPPPEPHAVPVFDMRPIALKVAQPAVPPALEITRLVVEAVEETER